jgi:hypothetical protein
LQDIVWTGWSNSPAAAFSVPTADTFTPSRNSIVRTAGVLRGHPASGCDVWAQAQHVDNIHNPHFTRMLTISLHLCTGATRANSRFASALSGGSPGGKTIPVP